MKFFFIIFAILLGLIVLLVQVQPNILHQHIFWIFGFIASTALLAHFLGKYGLDKDLQSAYLYFLGGMMIRLFCSLLLIGGYLYVGKYTRNENLLAISNFAFLYFVFAIVEVRSFLTTLHHKYKNL